MTQRSELRFTRKQAQQFDQHAQQALHVPGIVLMENAAINATKRALQLVNGPSPEVIAVSGSGNNGGDGYAIARQLQNAGCHCTIVSISDPKPDTDAAVNRQICEAIQIPVTDFDDATRPDLTQTDLIIDAIFGTGLDRTVEGHYADAIRWINKSSGNAQKVPVLAVDIPSGLDCDTGEIHGCAVHATMTVTFVARKAGFDQGDAPAYVGKVFVEHIGVPLPVSHP